MFKVAIASIYCAMYEPSCSPMEKLSNFFQGVQRLLDSGTPVDEVSYELAYSKQELGKCVALYPVKVSIIIILGLIGSS